MAKKKVSEKPKEEVTPISTTNLSDYEKKIDQADSLITKVWDFLKKHWGKLTILLLIYGGYKFTLLVGEEMDKPKQEQVQPLEEEIKVIEGKENPKLYVTSTYTEISKSGKPITILVWSDGLETVKEAITKPSVVSTFTEAGKTGDILTIQVWSDGVETIKK